MKHASKVIGLLNEYVYWSVLSKDFFLEIKNFSYDTDMRKWENNIFQDSSCSTGQYLSTFWFKKNVFIRIFSFTTHTYTHTHTSLFSSLYCSNRQVLDSQNRRILLMLLLNKNDSIPVLTNGNPSQHYLPVHHKTISHSMK